MRKSPFYASITQPVFFALNDAERTLWTFYFFYATSKNDIRRRVSIKCLPPTQREIAEKLNWCLRRVKKTHESLKGKGYLRSRKTKGNNTVCLHTRPREESD